MTSSFSSAAARSAAGGRPHPASTMTCLARHAGEHRVRTSVDRDRFHVGDRPAPPRDARSFGARVGRAVQQGRRTAANRGRPGRRGRGDPARPSASPARSTSRAGVGEVSAFATANTVVPLPPFAAQQIVSMSFLHVCGCGGEAGKVNLPSAEPRRPRPRRWIFKFPSRPVRRPSGRAVECRRRH